LVGGIVQHGLLQRNPRLGQSLGGQLQNLQNTPPSTLKNQAELRASALHRCTAQYTLFSCSLAPAKSPAVLGGRSRAAIKKILTQPECRFSQASTTRASPPPAR